MNEKLYQAINEVMKQVGYVQKQGRVTGGGASYTYAGEADLIAAIRPAMIEAGLAMYPAGVTNLTSEAYTTKSGALMNRVTGIFSFNLAHTSGEFIAVTTIGEGTDSGDKASYKAMTGAMKYALRQAFVIETGDDPDDTPSDDQHRAPVQSLDNPAPAEKPAPKQNPRPASPNHTAPREYIAGHIAAAKEADAGEIMTSEARQTLAIKMSAIFANDDERHAFMGAVLETGKKSITELTKAEGRALYSWASTPNARRQADDVLASIGGPSASEILYGKENA